MLYVTLDHKNRHKGQFFEIEIYTSSDSWINKLSIDVYGLLGQDRVTIWKSGIWGCQKKKKNLNRENRL